MHYSGQRLVGGGATWGLVGKVGGALKSDGSNDCVMTDFVLIRIGDIHFDRNTITTQNRKAGRTMAERPIPEEVMTELSNHVSKLPDGQERLFSDNFSPKLCKKTWKAAQLSGVKFHDLRKTFASLLAQRGVSTAVTQRLLEHSTPQLTNDVYTNVDPVLRQAISQLPVAEWV